jgi:hypothetical protein
MSTSVSVFDEERFQNAIADVRADSVETTWALFAHHESSPNVIECVGDGSGDMRDMVDLMDDAQFMYCLVRLEQAFDMSTTVKFAYVILGGKDVLFVRRGKFGVVQGAIEGLFSPYHITVEVDTKDDITQELIETKLQETSGTKSKVLEASEAKVRPERGFTSGTTTKADSTGSTPTKSSHMVGIGRAGSSFGGVSGKAKGSGGVVISEEVRAAVADVVANSSETVWCVASYEGGNTKKPIVLLGSGSGGSESVDEMKALCPDNGVAYGYIRMTDVVDDIPTVKFVYIQWVGETTKPMDKAKSATHKGAVEEVFSPAHVAIYASAKSDVTQRLLVDKVSAASGSKKSHLK